MRCTFGTVWGVSAPRLLLVPSFTELEWGMRPALERWAEVASFDTPGVGDTPLPSDLRIDASREPSELLRLWRAAAVERGLEEVDRRGWERFVVVTDSHGAPTATRLARRRRGSVFGLAIGHASLSHSTRGERPALREGVWQAMAQLAGMGSEPFVRYGIAQMTRGGIDEELAQQMLSRFPDSDIVVAVWESIASDPEPIGENLEELSVPMLLAKHEGCLGRTDEGFEDIVAAFPAARTVICPEACQASPAFAEALREFSERVLA